MSSDLPQHRFGFRRTAKGEGMPKLRGLGPLLAPHADTPAKNKRERPGATEMSRLTPAEADRQRQRVQDNAPEGVDLSHEGIVNRLMSMHHDYDASHHDEYHSGGDFYHHANKLAKNLANTHGLSQRAVTGVIAGLSPSTDWDRNVTQAMHLVANHRDYDHLPPKEAAKAYHATVGSGNEHGVVRNTVDNYAKAFHILRGGDPSDHLGGHKVRSFFNNILDPSNKGGVNSVTMDRHAISAAVGGTLSADRLKDIFYKGSSAEDNTRGTYAHFADAYRDAHSRLTDAGHDAGATPAHFQAKLWGVWRGQVNGNGKKGTDNRNVPHYAVKDDKENDGYFGGLIDPWGGPEGEPDPDLRPQQNAEYWRKRNKHEQQHPHGYGYPWFLGADVDDPDHDGDDDEDSSVGSGGDSDGDGGDSDGGGGDGGGVSASAAYNPSRGLLRGVMAGHHQSPAIDDSIKQGYGLDEENKDPQRKKDPFEDPKIASMRVSPDEFLFESAADPGWGDPYDPDYAPHDPYGIKPKKRYVKPTDKYPTLYDLMKGTEDIGDRRIAPGEQLEGHALTQGHRDYGDYEKGLQEVSDAYLRFNRQKLNSLQRPASAVQKQAVNDDELHKIISEVSKAYYSQPRPKSKPVEHAECGSEKTGPDERHKGGDDGCGWGDMCPKSMFHERKPVVPSNPKWNSLHVAIHGEDEVPPRMGTAPIPEGHIRLYHNTWERHVPGIREHGILESHAHGDGGMGAGNEPSAGVWAATGHPAGDSKLEGPHQESDRHTIEFHAHPDQVTPRAEHFWHEDPQEWAKGYHHVIMHGDIKPEQIVGIHAPWHSAYHYMSQPDMRGDTLQGKYDDIGDDPQYAHSYGKAIRKIKAEGRLSQQAATANLFFGGLQMLASGQYREDAEGDPNPSPWWQDQHSTAAPNPASTGPSGFGMPLDPEGPAEYSDTMGQSAADEKLLAPGPAISGMHMGPGWGFDSTAAKHTAATCRHCERHITHDEHGQWVDPEATGDDEVWREACDSNHETRSGEHEPKEREGEGGHPHLQLAAGLDGESSYYSYTRIPCPTCGGQGHDQSGHGACRNCGGQGYVLGHDGHEGSLHVAHNETHMAETHSLDKDYADRDAVKYQVRCRTCGYQSPVMPFNEAIEDHRSHERNARLPAQGLGFDEGQTAPYRLPIMPKSEELSDGRRPHPRTMHDPSKTEEMRRPTQYDADWDIAHMPHKLNSVQPAPDPLAWLKEGSSGSSGASGGHSESDIAKAAKAHLAALSLAEQQDLIKEGEAEDVRARNFDRLQLEGTHYMELEAKLSAEEFESGKIDKNVDDEEFLW